MSEIPLKVISATARVEEARLHVLNFRQQHADVLGEYDILLDDYNNAVSEAKVVIKDNEELLSDGFGEFGIVRVKSVDPDKLLEALGDDALPYLIHKTSVDRKAYDAAVDSGKIPQSVVVAAETVGSIQVRGPSEVGTWVPGRKTKKGRR